MALWHWLIGTWIASRCLNDNTAPEEDYGLCDGLEELDGLDELDDIDLDSLDLDDLDLDEIDLDEVDLDNY